MGAFIPRLIQKHTLKSRLGDFSRKASGAEKSVQKSLRPRAAGLGLPTTPDVSGSVGNQSQLAEPLFLSQGSASFKLLQRTWNFPGKNTGVGCHFLRQGNFPTQGSEPASLTSSMDTQAGCIRQRRGTGLSQDRAQPSVHGWHAAPSRLHPQVKTPAAANASLRGLGVIVWPWLPPPPTRALQWRPREPLNPDNPNLEVAGWEQWGETGRLQVASSPFPVESRARPGWGEMGALAALG